MNKINKNIFMVLLMASTVASSSHAAFAALGSKLASWGITKSVVGSMLASGAAYSVGAGCFESSSAQQTLKVAEGISSKVDVLALALKQNFTLKDVTGPLSFLSWGYQGLKFWDNELKSAYGLFASCMIAKNIIDSICSNKQQAPIGAYAEDQAALSPELATAKPGIVKIPAGIAARKAGRRANLDMYLQRV